MSAGDGLNLDLAALTAEHLVDWPVGGEVDIFEIEKGGSGRRFFRLCNGGRSIVAMVYNLDRPENADFAPITDFLAANGVPVPRIEARDEERRILWIEDLGEGDLWARRDADWDAVRRPAYEATLLAAAKIHALTEDGLRSKADLPHFQDPFDASMYRWEQSYFFDKFVARFSTASETQQHEVETSDELGNLAEELASLPRCLVHRDFQSQNVMTPDGKPRFIDYQGMRFGRAEYDVSSLLFDPYVKLNDEERDHLARFYHAHAQPDVEFSRFEACLLKCAVQRLMQALGAYGFLGIDRGQEMFLEHIPPALENLRGVAVDRGALPVLAPLLKVERNGVA